MGRGLEKGISGGYIYICWIEKNFWYLYWVGIDGKKKWRKINWGVFSLRIIWKNKIVRCGMEVSFRIIDDLYNDIKIIFKLYIKLFWNYIEFFYMVYCLS